MYSTMRNLLIAILVLPIFSFGQEVEALNYQELVPRQTGMFSVGLRTTLSAFNGHEEESSGTGIGGQFRLQFANRVNSDWFFDYITSDIGDYAKRTDYHVGWSVLFYFTDSPKPKFKPYILAGHCFDYTKFTDNSSASVRMERWSSAVQGGAGVHWNLSSKIDLSFAAQYMLHLGNEIEVERENGILSFSEHQGASLEGHMLFHVGINYTIGQLW